MRRERRVQATEIHRFHTVSHAETHRNTSHTTKQMHKNKKSSMHAYMYQRMTVQPSLNQPWVQQRQRKMRGDGSRQSVITPVWLRHCHEMHVAQTIISLSISTPHSLGSKGNQHPKCIHEWMNAFLFFYMRSPLNILGTPATLQATSEARLTD